MPNEPTTIAALTALRRLSPSVRVKALSDALEHADSGEAEQLGCELLSLAVQHIEGLLRRTQAEPAYEPGRVVSVFHRVSSRFTGADEVEAAEEAASAVVLNWPKLPDDVRRLALSVDPRIWVSVATPLAERAAQGEAGPAYGVMGLLEDAPFGRFAEPACKLLHAEERQVVRAAEGALHAMVAPLLGEWPISWLDGESRPRQNDSELAVSQAFADDTQGLINAVADAAWSYPVHMCRGPVASALLLLAASREGRLDRRHIMRIERLLEDRDHAAHTALARVMRRSRAPLIRRLAFRLLTDPNIAAAALDRVAIAASVTDHDAMLRLGHLSLNPRRVRTLGTLRVQKRAKASSSGLIPGPSVLRRLPENARRNLLRVMEPVSIAEDVSRNVIETYMVDESPSNRLAACHNADVRDLPDFCFDSSASVARHAMHRWSRADDSRSMRWPPKPADEWRIKLLTKLARTRHPEIRAMSTQELSASTPWAAEDPRSRLLAFRWDAGSRNSMEASIRRRLAESAVGGKVSTIMTLRKLGFVPRFEQEIIAIVDEVIAKEAEATQADERLLATAVIALSGAKSIESCKAVRRASEATDPRVRANAVEATGARLRRPFHAGLEPARLIELKSDQHHRVRANAVRELLRGTEAVQGKPTNDRVYEPIAIEELRAMLTDTREAHRLAAAWLAGRVLVGPGKQRLGPHWEPLTRALADTARDDEDASVRRRAKLGVRRVLGEMRAAEVVVPSRHTSRHEPRVPSHFNPLVSGVSS